MSICMCFFVCVPEYMCIGLCLCVSTPNVSVYRYVSACACVLHVRACVCIRVVRRLEGGSGTLLTPVLGLTALDLWCGHPHPTFAASSLLLKIHLDLPGFCAFKEFVCVLPTC